MKKVERAVGDEVDLIFMRDGARHDSKLTLGWVGMLDEEQGQFKDKSTVAAARGEQEEMPEKEGEAVVKEAARMMEPLVAISSHAVLHVPKSVRKKAGRFFMAMDTAFDQVIDTIQRLNLTLLFWFLL